MKKTSQYSDDIQKFGKQIEELNRVLEKSKSDATSSPAVIERVDRLFVYAISHHNEFACSVGSPSSLNTRLEELHKIASRSLMKRLVHYKDDARSVSEHIQSITWSVQSFTVCQLAFVNLSLADLSQVETMVAIEFSLDVSYTALTLVI
jgi:hypothetical protein